MQLHATKCTIFLEHWHTIGAQNRTKIERWHFCLLVGCYVHVLPILSFGCSAWIPSNLKNWSQRKPPRNCSPSQNVLSIIGLPTGHCHRPRVSGEGCIGTQKHFALGRTTCLAFSNAANQKTRCHAGADPEHSCPTEGSEVCHGQLARTAIKLKLASNN